VSYCVHRILSSARARSSSSRRSGGHNAVTPCVFLLHNSSSAQLASFVRAKASGAIEVSSEVPNLNWAVGWKRWSSNTLQQARAALDKLRAGRNLPAGEGTPIQLQTCPWCGTKLGPDNYYISKKLDRH
jgi:hypothetical protein